MVISETTAFTRRVRQLLTDDEYAEVRSELTDKPQKGKVIRESGGIRKMRCAAKGRGKSGGARIIYYLAVAQDQILMLFIYGKNEQEDLTKDQIQRLRRVVEEMYP